MMATPGRPAGALGADVQALEQLIRKADQALGELAAGQHRRKMRRPPCREVRLIARLGEMVDAVAACASLRLAAATSRS